MSELIIANKSDIVAIADAIREKTGQTGGMSLDTMDEAIEGISGGGSGGSAVETCTVTIKSNHKSYYPTNIAYMTLDSNKNIIYKNEIVSSSSITVSCLKNSIVTVKFQSAISEISLSSKCLFFGATMAVYKIDNENNLEISNDFGGGSID